MDGRPQPFPSFFPLLRESQCRGRCSFVPGGPEGLSFPPRSAGRLRSRRRLSVSSASLPQSRQRSRTSLGKDSSSAEKGTVETRFVSSTKFIHSPVERPAIAFEIFGQVWQVCSARSAGWSHCDRERQKPSQFVLRRRLSVGRTCLPVGALSPVGQSPHGMRLRLDLSPFRFPRCQCLADFSQLQLPAGRLSP